MQKFAYLILMWPVYLALGIVGGILLFLNDCGGTFLGILLALLCLSKCFNWHKLMWPLSIIFLSCLLGYYRAHCDYHSKLTLWEDKNISAQGKVIKSYSQSRKLKLLVNLTSSGDNLLLSGRKGKDTFNPGDEINFKGLLVPLLEESQYYKRYNITHKIELSELHLTRRTKKSWRSSIIEAGNKNIPTRYRALVLGLVLGTSELIPIEQKELLRDAGLSHMLAASGFHLASLAGMVTLLGQKIFHINKRYLAALVWLVSLSYAHLAYWTPSITRAFFMLSFYLLAAILGRPCWNWRFLFLVLAGVLIYEPHLLEDVGLQLSFLAVGGIFLWFSPLERSLNFLPKLASTSLALSLSSVLLIAPLLVFYFGQLATSFVLTSLLIAPLLEGIFFASWPCLVPINLGPIAPFFAYICGQLCEGTFFLSGIVVKWLPPFKLHPPSITAINLYYTFILSLRLIYHLAHQPTCSQTDLLDDL